MGKRQSERVGPDCKSGGISLSRCESYFPHQKKLDTCIYLCYNYIIEGKNDNGFNRSDGWFLNFFWSRSSHRNLGMDCNVLINNTIGENKNVYDGKDSRRRN